MRNGNGMIARYRLSGNAQQHACTMAVYTLNLKLAIIYGTNHEMDGKDEP